MGRGGCYEREGRRSWRLLGHACVATLLLVNAVANSTRHSNCTATDMETNHPRSRGRVFGHHFGPLPSISPHHDCLPRSCLRPSGSAAAPELPVLEVAGQHRICTIVTPTSTPGQREDVHAGASSHVNSFSGQRVNYSANGLTSTMSSTRQTLPGSPKLSRHRRNIGLGPFPCGRCYIRAYAAGTHQLPLSDRDVKQVSARDLPCLMQPLLALDTHDTDGWWHAASFPLRCAQFERATRFGQGQGVVGPTSLTSRALCARRSAAFWGASHDGRGRLATDPEVASKITCTLALHYNDSHLSRSSYFAPKNEPLLRPALVTAVGEVWRGYLPFQARRCLGRHATASLLHCTHCHFCTACRLRLGSWAPTTASMYSTPLGALHTTPRPRHGGSTALHKRTTATPKHGSTSGSPHCCCRITSG